MDARRSCSSGPASYGALGARGDESVAIKPRKPLLCESNGIRTFGKGLVQRPQILHAANFTEHVFCPLESRLIANANRTRQTFLQDVAIA
jgi:hypothetical protein